jgi:putative heme-binding domain-containing protein
MRHSKLLFLGLQLLLCWGAPAVRAQSEWTELVDGKGLAGWRGEARFWSVEDGAIVGRSTKETPCDATTYLLRDGLEFEDFELVAEYKVVGGNSGIQFRSKDLGGHQVAGPQADIEDGDSWSGCLYEQDGRGVMTTRGERCVFADGRKDARRFADGKELQRRAVRRHDWNTYRVVAVGGTIVLEINGVRTSETVDRDPARAVRGLVAVQLHAGPPMEVRYRSIKVRRLGPADEPKLDEIGHGTAELHLLPGPLPHWLWAGEQPGQSERVLLEREFVVPFAPAWARLLASGDNHVVAWINGRRLFVHDDWSRLAGADATGAVVEGANALQLAARNDGGPAGAWCELVVAAADGRRMRLVSDASFSSISLVGEVDIESLDPATIERGRTGPAHSFGAMGVAPWGMIDDQDGATSDARVPAALGADDIELAEGFAIELMHQPDPATQGSWVALCEAPGGFLYAADQYGSIWRARMAARPLEFARVPAAISGAHGLLWHGGALHCVVAEGSDGARTGLWRVDDADGDGLPDSPRLLRAFEGGGEHGPHGLVTGPDGRIWIVGGNHTALPDCTTSRVPRLWAEDDLVPTIEDPRGHANGIRAPGGWIVAVDDDGRDFELWSMGYRNAYDLAFDARGELYTWDSDMEWDVGAPWYRPVRIVQAVSGSDFGWRTGSSNWPTSWLDTLPSTADLGRGSPTGLVFGTGLAAPERWQRALYACDWSFGTIWALDVDEAGAGSRAAAIPFLRGTPFPATDIIVGSDGALWISTGGRRTRSGVYRAHWNGGGSFAPAAVPPASGSLVARRALERLHGPGRAWSADDARGVLAALRGGDRHLAHAARAALEHADAARFDAIVAAAGAPDADLVLVALRRFPVERRALALEHLARLERDSLEALRDWLRLAQLACLRLAPLSGAEEAALRAQVEALEFRGDERADRDLATLLAHFSGDGALSRLVARLEDEAEQEDQLHLGHAIAAARGPIGLDLRRRFLERWNTIQPRMRGGESLELYAERIRERFVAGIPATELAHLADAIRAPSRAQAAPAAAPRKAPVRNWTRDEVRRLLADGSATTSAARGRAAWEAATCSACHRIAGEGGSSGPDLTTLGSRFGVEDLLDSLFEPSRTISDQYADTEIQTAEGDLHVGRVERTKDGALRLVEPSGQVVEIDEASIVVKRPWKVSRMPAGLLDHLQAEEVRALVDYSLGRAR